MQAKNKTKLVLASNLAKFIKIHFILMNRYELNRMFALLASYNASERACKRMN